MKNLSTQVTKRVGQAKRQHTDHGPDMQAQTQAEVDEGDADGDLELADQDADQASLEDEGVEEQEEDDDDCKHQADVLNPATNDKLWHQ